MLSNNEILKKIKIALSLQQEDVMKILALSDFEISKGALGDMFRNEDNPGYMEAGDQILRHFLNGLIIYKRGPQLKPENKKPESKLKDTPPVEKYFKKNESGLKKKGMR